MLWTRLRTDMVRLTARRYRRILIASAITLVTSAILLVLIGVTRWRGHQALQSDTHTVMTQVTQQLLRSIQSRRGTLTFLRDTLARQPDLTPPQLQAMGASAVEHTRHLLGIGLIRTTQNLVWWTVPTGLSRGELASVSRSVNQRIQLRGAWRVASTFVTMTRPHRPLLVMLEPIPEPGMSPQSAIAGVFDLQPLLEDFFASGLPQRYPVQLLSDQLLLYRSSSWQPLTSSSQIVVAEAPVILDAERWRIQLQPGTTRIVQTLSWFTVLLISLSLIAGLGVTALVWILAARTWILQRAVDRRTAALRRTLGRMRQMAVTDELTGLYNRRFFLDRWEWECERAKRYQRPLACLMIDVNNFKQVNDRLGHHAGDLVLKQVAQELRTLLRQSDLLARFGGDEFIVALPETSLGQVTAVAEKLRQITIPIPEAHGRQVPPVSLSVGISRIEKKDESSQEVLDAADQSLYAHKRRTQSAATSPEASHSQAVV